MVFFKRTTLLAALAAALLISACSGPVRFSAGNTNVAVGKIEVVATTTIVGNVVQNIAGDNINLTILIPENVDEHGYEPTPRDIASVAQADLVFENGAGLETFMQKLMDSAGGKAKRISVSDGIQLLQSAEDTESSSNSGGQSGDPHVWMDPNNVMVWVDNIANALAQADPKHAAEYKTNAEAYRQKLNDLDNYIHQQVELVPAGRRKLVTDHLVFTYFASRYGFQQVGAVVPGYSTLAAPSAQQIAALEDEIRKLQVPVIFVGNTVNPAMEERVAKDTGTRLVHILTGSLTDVKGPGPSYLAYMRYNVQTIVGALK